MQEQGISGTTRAKILTGKTEDFSGGMLQAVNSARLSNSQYTLLINGRNRYADIRPIKKAKNLTGRLQSGNYQAIFASDPYLFMFVDGVAYVTDLTGQSSSDDVYFQSVNGFSAMDRTVDRIYVESVPSSTANHDRKLVDSLDISAGVKLGSSILASPQCLVCQDTINRPRLIFSPSHARTAQDFNDWYRSEDVPSMDQREYIPIGGKMLYTDGILYIVNGSEIYRSVFGRPLDFVIAVDENGDKLPVQGVDIPEASRLSHRVGYEDITSIQKINTKVYESTLAGGFFVSTGKFSWVVIPNLLDTLYGEPKFKNIDLFPTGPVNNFSFINIEGDIV
jgi:hypothetical protein